MLARSPSWLLTRRRPKVLAWRWTLKKLPKVKWDLSRSANFSPHVKHFLGCKKNTKSNKWVSFWGLTFLIDENCKITEPMHSWTRVLSQHFVPRFRRRDSLPEPETPRIFALSPGQFLGWQEAKLFPNFTFSHVCVQDGNQFFSNQKRRLKLSRFFETNRFHPV